MCIRDSNWRTVYYHSFDWRSSIERLYVHVCVYVCTCMHVCMYMYLPGVITSWQRWNTDNIIGHSLLKWFTSAEGHCLLRTGVGSSHLSFFSRNLILASFPHYLQQTNSISSPLCVCLSPSLFYLFLYMYTPLPFTSTTPRVMQPTSRNSSFMHPLGSFLPMFLSTLQSNSKRARNTPLLIKQRGAWKRKIITPGMDFTWRCV